MTKKLPFSVLAILTATSFQLSAAELPADIEWTSNNNEPLFASEEAVHGGTYRTYIQSFPQTLRSVGPDANSGLRQYLMDGTPKMAQRHPNPARWHAERVKGRYPRTGRSGLPRSHTRTEPHHPASCRIHRS